MNIVKRPAVVFSLAEGLIGGGVVTWTLSLSKRLRQQGITSTIISHSPRPDQGVFDAGDRDDIIQCPGHAQTFEVKDIQGFLPVYLSVQPGVFVPNYSYGTYGAAALASLDPASDLRVVAIAHTDEKTYYDTIAYYEPIISKFIAVSSEIKDKLDRLFPLRRNDIVKLAYPVPVTQGHKAHDKAKPLTIAYVGRLWQWQKRIFDLKELAHRLADQDGRYRFTIAGYGYCETELKAFFENNRFQNVSVDFLGLVDHDKINEVWAQSDVNVLFSDHEGMSISMLEGMGQGCVPVVTKVSGTRDTLVNGKTGFLISIGDMKAMARALNRLNADRKMLEAMSEACIEHIRVKHSFEQYDQAFIDLLGQAWSCKPSRWPAGKPVVPAKPKTVDSPAPMYRRFHQRVLSKVGRIFRGLFKRK